MQKVTIPPFQIIGIAIRTSIENGQDAIDIGQLWGKFMSENVIAKIPNTIDHTIYALYTEYEGDYTQPYTTLLGCKVHSLDTIPDGMIGKTFKGGNYVKFSDRGDIMKGFVGSKWTEIRQMDLNRAYTVDFEVYGEKAQNPNNAEIDFLIAIN